MRKSEKAPEPAAAQLLMPVHFPGGHVVNVCAARAARLVANGEAEPGDWTREDLAAVEAAHHERQRRTVEALKADGLLIPNEGPPHGGYGWARGRR
jgi:hypothetical protein